MAARSSNPGSVIPMTRWLEVHVITEVERRLFLVSTEFSLILYRQVGVFLHQRHHILMPIRRREVQVAFTDLQRTRLAGGVRAKVGLRIWDIRNW
jgi:hypothetical protein